MCKWDNRHALYTYPCWKQFKYEQVALNVYYKLLHGDNWFKNKFGSYSHVENEAFNCKCVELKLVKVVLYIFLQQKCSHIENSISQSLITLVGFIWCQLPYAISNICKRDFCMHYYNVTFEFCMVRNISISPPAISYTNRNKKVRYHVLFSRLAQNNSTRFVW